MGKKVHNLLPRLRKHYRDIYWWRNFLVQSILSPILFRNDGTYILEEEWDNLIILDACRYDVFEEIYKKRKLRGRLEYRISRGTDTLSFLLENFSLKDYYEDIVYVTANPFVDKVLRGRFFRIVSVWKTGWDERYRTVLPSTMYKYALKALKKYPDKRLIIHFIQPHYPYLVAPNIDDDSLNKLRKDILEGKIPRVKNRREKRVSFLKIAQRDFYLYIDRKLHWLIYKKNLEIVMDYVERLINVLPGRTVVTSDHGEAFGEKLHPLLPFRVYGHVYKLRIPAIVKVPWLIIEPEDKEPLNLEEELIKISIKTLKAKLFLHHK